MTVYQHTDVNQQPESWPKEPEYGSERYGFESNFSAMVSSRDVTCRITGHFSGTDVCHMCPKSEINWFQRNNTTFYNKNPILGVTTNDMSNAMLLRRDLHVEFDLRVFVFVPKGPTSGFVVHFFQPTDNIGIISSYFLGPIQGLMMPQGDLYQSVNSVVWKILSSATIV